MGRPEEGKPEKAAEKKANDRGKSHRSKRYGVSRPFLFSFYRSNRPKILSDCRA